MFQWLRLLQKMVDDFLLISRGKFLREILPDIVEFGVGADAQSFRIGADGVEFALGVKFGASHGLDVLEGCHGDESGPTAGTAAVAGVEV